ncbi:MAG: hypothetical protein PVG60_09140, partial [Desulfarculaceae bacterium]
GDGAARCLPVNHSSPVDWDRRIYNNFIDRHLTKLKYLKRGKALEKLRDLSLRDFWQTIR